MVFGAQGFNIYKMGKSAGLEVNTDSGFIISSLSKPDFTFIVQPRESLTIKAGRLSEGTGNSINKYSLKDERGRLLKR